MTMDRISADEYRALIDCCQVLEKDGYGEKVLLDPAGQIVKIFRRKRLLSSALFYPYSRRFARNAHRLMQCGISTVNVTRLAACPQPKRQLVWYDPLPGDTLRNSCLRMDPGEMMNLLGAFVADLHERGVLFRSLHWGNVIVQPDMTLGLIDIADLSFQRNALSLKQRQRNFRHMLRYAEDRELFTQLAEPFWLAYGAVSKLSDHECGVLRHETAAMRRI